MSQNLLIDLQLQFGPQGVLKTRLLLERSWLEAHQSIFLLGTVSLERVPGSMEYNKRQQLHLPSQICLCKYPIVCLPSASNLAMDDTQLPQFQFFHLHEGVCHRAKHPA